MKKEEWKPLFGYEDQFLISNLGRVYQNEHLDARGYKRKGKFVSTKTTVHKYESFSPDKGKSRMYVHRAVALSFLGFKGSEFEVNHKDGNTKNNHLCNLEWCTRQENITHSRVVLKRKPEEKNKKRVFCIELQRWFSSTKNAICFCNKKAETLTSCLDKKNKTYCGYHWSSVEKPYIETEYTEKGKRWVKCLETNETHLGVVDLATKIGVTSATLREAISRNTKCRGNHYIYL